MTRTQRNYQGRHGGAGKASSGSQRQSQISRTLSKVLRHQAENERIAITKDGWVKLSDLLAWRGFSDPGKFNLAVTVDDIMDVIKEDGIHGKGRFGLKLADGNQSMEQKQQANDLDMSLPEEMADKVQQLSLDDNPDTSDATRVSQSSSTGSKNSPETLSVIAYQAEHPNVSPTAYLIRATQGHSIKAIESEGLLTPITLEDPTSIPDTVVHGTFYGAWDGILSTGGLKAMSRNMVHFASGPALSEVLPSTYTDTDPDPQLAQKIVSLKSKKQVDDMLSQNKVISGMRWDAQILIYIDLKRLLQDVRDRGWEMKWWRSDNGVILSEGVSIQEEDVEAIDAEPADIKSTQVNVPSDSDHENHDTAMTTGQKAVDHKARKESKQPRPKANVKQKGKDGNHQKVVPLAYFDAVVEIKADVGLLWRAGEGVVRELPEELRSKGVPRGKGGRASDGKPKKNDKPRMRVERDTDLRAQIDHGDS